VLPVLLGVVLAGVEAGFEDDGLDDALAVEFVLSPLTSAVLLVSPSTELFSVELSWAEDIGLELLSDELLLFSLLPQAAKQNSMQAINNTERIFFMLFPLLFYFGFSRYHCDERSAGQSE